MKVSFIKIIFQKFKSYLLYISLIANVFLVLYIAGLLSEIREAQIKIAECENMAQKLEYIFSLCKFLLSR